jgi:hypothetical protein
VLKLFAKGFAERSVIGSLAVALASISCSSNAASENDAAQPPAAETTTRPDTSVIAPKKSSAPDSVSESDQMLLAAAATACKNGDPNAFFDSFIQSKAVQQKYSARSIESAKLSSDFSVDSWEEAKAADYTAFPIVMVDYYRKSAQPLRQGVDEHVMIELNQSQTESFAVDWTRVTYDGKSSGGDDLGNAFKLDGTPYRAGEANTDGKLVFVVAGDCWNFTSDIRHLRPAAAQ